MAHPIVHPEESIRDADRAAISAYEHAARLLAQRAQRASPEAANHLRHVEMEMLEQAAALSQAARAKIDYRTILGGHDAD